MIDFVVFHFAALGYDFYQEQAKLWNNGVLTLPPPIASWNTIPPSQSVQNPGERFLRCSR
jgi:hypothetical protein